MPYIVSKETFGEVKEDLIGKLFEEFMTLGPVTNAYVQDNGVVLEFVSGERRQCINDILTPIHPALIPYLSLLRKYLRAVMPDENNEEWSCVGVDIDMERLANNYYFCTKLEMVEGVPAVYLDNGFWYPASCYEVENKEPITLIGQYNQNHFDEGWIKDCYIVGKMIFYKTMCDNWYSTGTEKLNEFTRNEPRWLSAGSHVVLLRACELENPWTDGIPLNYVYRLKETASMHNFMIDVDNNLSTSNGWYLPKGAKDSYKYNYLKLRPATLDEAMLYSIAERPIPINPTTNSNSVVEIQEPQEEIIKTKRLSSKNYL